MAGLLKNNLLKAVWLLCHIAFVFGTVPATAQHNLVPNGGFEVLDTCPNNPFQIRFASPWQGIGTPDLFHGCCTVKQPQYMNYGVPDNWMGWQMPHTGYGYAGIYFYEIIAGSAHSCEYLQIKLSNKLVTGQPYCYQYFISPSIKSTNMVFKEFSILLSDTPVVWNTWTPSQNHHYINANPTSACNTGFTTDTAVWYEVKGEFIAQGGEEYLTIGFFHSITSADTLMLSSGYDKQAYYFIDDVSLWYCGPDTIPKPIELPLPIIPNVFTPNGDGFNDLFQYAKSEGWNLQTCIRNRWGQVVFEGINDQWWDGTTHGQPAATGVYYYTVTASNQFGQHEMFNGVVTVLR